MNATLFSPSSLMLRHSGNVFLRYHQLRYFQDIYINPRSQRSRHQESKRRSKSRTNRQRNYHFVDRTRLRACGGEGGKGSLSCETIRRKFKLKPDGGHGGDGGSVFIVADPKEQALRRSLSHARAGKGANGTSQNCSGRNGQNLAIRVPCGVIVKRVLDSNEYWDSDYNLVRKRTTAFRETVNYDSETETSNFFTLQNFDNNGQYFDQDENGNNFLSVERETVVIADLDEPGASVLVARGGRGGTGSCIYASEHGPRPDISVLVQNAKPQPGEVSHLELELKLIADVGLVGFPNAGKSSLLRAMSYATPKIAPYPFTTINPIVGCIDYQDGFRVSMADIPGLIDGASTGRGKGQDFLRHIERTKALLYIVDVASVDQRSPIEDLHVLAREISTYGDGSLLERPALVVANKVDLVSSTRLQGTLDGLSRAAEDLGIITEHNIFGISAGVTGIGLETLATAIRNVVASY